MVRAVFPSPESTLIPGRTWMRSAMFRCVGSSLIISSWKPLWIPAAVTSTIGDSPVTVTVSAMVESFKAMSTLAVAFRATRTASKRLVSKLGSAASTS